MKRIYVSGQMSGLPDFGAPAFNKAAADLRASGFDVVNPAELDAQDTAPKSWAEYMRRDIQELVTCDAIAMIPGYENSRGACLELTIAKTLGFEVMHLGEPPTEGGIYSIVGPNGRQYIGQTQSFNRRWSEHKSALRGNRHHCASLQRAWNKYGEAEFSFEAMFVVEPGGRDRVEQSWLDALGRSRLYNSALDVLSAGKGLSPSVETRAKMSAAHSGARNHNFGKAMSEKQKKAISAARTGKPVLAMRGRAKSPEHRANLSRAITGKRVGAKNPRARPIMCVEQKIAFVTVADAVRWLIGMGHKNADHSFVRKAAIGKVKSAYGFTWLEKHIADALGMESIYLQEPA